MISGSPRHTSKAPSVTSLMETIEYVERARFKGSVNLILLNIPSLPIMSQSFLYANCFDRTTLKALIQKKNLIHKHHSRTVHRLLEYDVSINIPSNLFCNLFLSTNTHCFQKAIYRLYLLIKLFT